MSDLTRADRLELLAAQATALAAPFRSEAVYERRNPRSHRREQVSWGLTVPSLLDQVTAAVVPSPARDDIFVAMPYASRAPAAVEALACLERVAGRVYGWLQAAGVPGRGRLADEVRAVVGIATALDDRRLGLLAADVADWHRRCRVLTGWDPPAAHPSAGCPLCGRRGLWIRLDTHHAGCSRCGAGWTPANIGLLADYLRAGQDEPDSIPA